MASAGAAIGDRLSSGAVFSGDDTDDADRFVQRQRDGAGWRIMHAAFEFVGHAGVVKQPLDGEVDFGARRFCVVRR
jgi:hypothetical protein